MQPMMHYRLSRLFLCSSSMARMRRSMTKTGTRTRIKVERRRGRKSDRQRSLIAGQAYGSNDGLPNRRRKSGRRRRRRSGSGSGKRRKRKKRRKKPRGAKIKTWDRQLLDTPQHR